MIQVKSAALLMTALLMSGIALRPQDDIDPEKYARVKAAMVLNFVRYTTWPDECFDDTEDEKAPLTVLVLGRDSMQSELEKLVRDEVVHGRALRARRIDYPEPDPKTRRIEQAELDRFYDELRRSHLLFIAANEEDHLREALQTVREHKVLTASDIDDFAERGGMLGIAVRNGRVAIDANVDEINETKLQVSSKLLRLARVVKTREERR